MTGDAAAVCTPGWASRVRSVSESSKDEVFAEYGIRSHSGVSYEVDHLVPLELGGSNETANLWPPGFHKKDVAENRLHPAVCAGAMSLRRAQQVFAKDWTKALTTELGSSTPPASSSPPSTSRSSASTRGAPGGSTSSRATTCKSFSSQAVAQRWWERHGRPARLDRDHDGRVCEALR